MLSVSDGKASARGSPGFFLFVSWAGLILTLASAPAFAQEGHVIRAIRIVGNVFRPSSEIQAWMETKPGGPFVASDVERVSSRYASEGFPFASVDSLKLVPTGDGSSVDLVLWLREGKPAQVSSIRWEGMKALTDSSVGAVLTTHMGERFIPESIEHDIISVLSLYEMSGYPFAKIHLLDLSFVEGNDSVAANIVLGVEEGSLAHIRGLQVEGNTVTSTEVIVRQAGLKEGEVFRGDQPAKVRQRLERMQLFSKVSLPELIVNKDGSVGLSVKVAEGNPNLFDGIVGYVPSSVSGGSGYVTGLLDVQFRNILGTGRRLGARWYRENASSQEIELHYREPWVASLPINAEVGFVQRKQDSTYVRNTYNISAQLMATDELNLGVIFSAERILPTEGYGFRVSSESRTTSIGVSVSYDSRDDPLTPTSGLSYRTEYLTGVKEIQGQLQQSAESRSSMQRLSFDLEYVFSPSVRQVLAASLHVRDFRNDAVEISDLYRLGGANTLRGYREGQFLGSRIAWSNLEYRLLTGQRSYAFGFFDFGYVATPDRPEVGLIKQELNRVGYGLGIRLDTSLGLMGVSLAFGQGDTFSTAKLHFRLVNEF